MNVAVALETRFVRTPDGAFWSLGWLDQSFWRRYLDVFDEVKVIARVVDASEPPSRARRADGAGISFAALPYYVGPWQYLARLRSLRKAASAMISPDEAVILRVPGAIGSLIESRAAGEGRPFGVEVVGDPLEVFAAGSVKSPLGPLLRWRFTRALQRQCRQACAVSYVTRNPLLQRYPARSTAFVTAYSSIDLCDEAFAAESRRYLKRPKPLKIVSVGSLEQLYKGPDVLIKAVALVVQTTGVATGSGTPLTLTLVGDGKHRSQLERLAEEEGVSGFVHFAGKVPAGGAVRAELDKADLFVLASRTEGLPRAMIEAMARGLPCIGTSVGGIPELLEHNELVRPDDVRALAERIAKLARDREQLSHLSAQNIEKARAYHVDELRPRRLAMYEAVRDRTSDWLKSLMGSRNPISS